MSRFTIEMCSDCRDYLSDGGCATDEADDRVERGLQGLADLRITVEVFDIMQGDVAIGWESDQNCDVCDAVGGVHWRGLAMSEPVS